MRKLLSFMCAMLFVIGAFNMVPMAFSHNSVKAASSRAGCPGSWTINSVVTIDPGYTCTVNSNILIQSGGSLTVKKSTIKMNVASDGQYNITIQNGGQLHILQNSTLTSDGVHRSNLKAQGGSTLEIRDSDISYFGYLMPNIGIEIYTSNAVIDNNNITNGFQGVYVQNSAATITHNRVLSMDQTGIEASVSNSYIANNTIKNSGARGIMIDQGGASMKVYNNTLYNNYEGIHLKVNTVALIQGNWVDQHNNSGRDIIVDQSDPIIDGNHLKNARAGIQFMGLCGGVAKNNILQYGDGSGQDVGIMVQQQSNPLITNNTIDNFWRGMQVTGLSDPVVEKNKITNSIHAGIYLNSGKGTYRNNTITTATGDGINMISNTDAKFYDNWIHDNGNDGIHADSSKVVIINNNISKNPLTGLHLIGTATTADVRDNLFIHDGNGVVLGDTAVATLRNNQFWDNVGGAINVGASTHVDWTVDKPLLARNNDITLAGNLTIKSTGNLELRNLYMRMASTTSNKYWIDAQGPLFLNVSFVAAQTPAYAYSLRTTSDLTVVDGGITNAGYTYAGLGQDAGVFINGGTGTFLRSYISHGFYGLIANGGTVTMEQCSIDNNGMDGIKAEGGATVVVSNSTMTLNTDKDLVLDGVSTIDMRNSTFNGNAVTLSDANSKLHVSWFVGVKVAWPDLSGNPGDPVNGATVVVKQAGGTAVATKVTDANGSIGPYLVLKEYTKMQGGRTDYSPYNITASISPIVVGYKVAPIQQSQVVTVMLGDLTPPLVNISSPLDNAVFNYVNITIKGTASDAESGIKSVAVSTDDGGSWKPALGTTNWNLTLFFGEGTYKIMAKACNLANGCSTASVLNIYVDKTPPIILWTSPANNSLLNKKNVVVSGTTEANAHLTVNTVLTNASAGGAFSTDLPLIEGPNTISITATDRAQNSRTSVRYVTVDTIAPFINIDGPLNKTVTVIQMEITGATEIGAKVSINSGAVNVNPSTGIFSYPVLLTEGPNFYKFDAVDKAGNKNSITVTITLDTKAPTLTVVYPADGASLKNKTVKAQALTEPNPDGTILGFINGQQVTVDASGAFSGDVSLVEGDNVISFRVQDAAGNNASKTVRISMDSSVPTITELTPATGTQVANTATTVWIEGKTEPRATVTIGTKTTTAGAQGAFSIEVPLAVGPNNITIKVTDKAGNTYTKSITITRKTTGGCVGAGCNHNNNNTTKPGTDWSKFLPFILIIVVILVVVGAAAAFAGRKAPPPPPRRRREEDYPRGRDQYARGVERGGAYPRAPGQQEQYDDGYDQGPPQGEYDQGYTDDQYADQGSAQQGYDQGGQDQGYGDDQYANQSPNNKGRRY